MGLQARPARELPAWPGTVRPGRRSRCADPARCLAIPSRLETAATVSARVSGRTWGCGAAG